MRGFKPPGKVPIRVAAEVRHPLHPGTPKLRLNPKEYRRLVELLRASAGPTPWYASAFPRLRGPRTLSLVWRELRGPKYATIVVPEGREDPAFLALGFHCYVFCFVPERMLVWHHTGPVAKRDTVRLILLNTTELGPLPDIPSLDSGEVRIAGGVTATADMPVTWDRGRYHFEFPRAMHDIPPFLMLVSTRPPDKALPVDTGHLEAIYSVSPRTNEVGVIPLDWWNQGDFDFGYEWISQVVRDPQTGNILGDGFRIFPFLARSDGEFISWVEEAR